MIQRQRTPRSTQQVAKGPKHYWSNQVRERAAAKKEQSTAKNFEIKTLPKVSLKNTINKSNFTGSKSKLNKGRKFGQKKQRTQAFANQKNSINKFFKTINKKNKFFDGKEGTMKSESSISMARNLSCSKKKKAKAPDKIELTIKNKDLANRNLKRRVRKKEDSKDRNFHSQRQILSERGGKLNSTNQVNVIKLHGNINNFYNYSHVRDKARECSNSVNFQTNDLSENMSMNSRK